MNEIDQILQQMQELTGVIRSHQANGDRATLDPEVVTAEFAKLHQALAQLQQPVRRGEEIEAAAPTSGKFAGADPRDVMLAHKLLSAAAVHGNMGPSAELSQAVKAMTSTGAATGDELVPTNMAPMLWEDIYNATNIAQLIPVQPMTSDPMDISLSLGDVTMRKGTQNTATTATDLATAKSTLTSTEIVGEVNWSYSLEEDAVVAVMPQIRATLVRCAAEYWDRFILNADATDAATGNINSDDSNPADDSYYLSDGQDGIRHQWLVDASSMGASAGGDALTDDDVLAAFGRLGRYFQDSQSNVVIVPDYSTYLNGFLKLAEVQTVDKFGAAATILRGQLGAFMGVPIVPSYFHPLGASDGKANASSGNTLGSMSIFNRQMWRAGIRRAISVEVDRNIQTRQYIMVVSFRAAVGTRGTRSAQTHTAGVYNILVAS
jgi:HK97 family phage major capsid protein